MNIQNIQRTANQQEKDKQLNKKMHKGYEKAI